MELVIIEGISSGIFDGKAYVLLPESNMLWIESDATELVIIYDLEDLTTAAGVIMVQYGYEPAANEQASVSQLSENIWLIKIKWKDKLNLTASGELGMHLVGLRQGKTPRFR
jgi:hypothetical protein